MAHRRLLALALAAAAVLTPASARAGDPALLRAATTHVPRVVSAALAADGGRSGSDAVQRQYDAARDLQEALISAAPASAACAPFAAALAGYAAAQVAAAEGFDRQRPAQTARGGSDAARALTRVRRARGPCAAHPARTTPVKVTPRLDDPTSFEAFFGVVRAQAPRAAATATVSFGGRLVGRTAIRDGRLRTRISASPARGNLVVTFLSTSGQTVGHATSRSV